MQHQHQHQLPRHGMEPHGDQDADGEQQQTQGIAQRGGVDALQGEVKAVQADDGYHHDKQARQQKRGAQAETDPFTDHAVPSPFACGRTG